MKASDVGQIVIGHPPAIGGGVKSRDLPSQIFDFHAMSDYSDVDDEIQQQILDRVPSQIEGLRMKRERIEDSALQTQLGDSTAPAKPQRRKRARRWFHEPNPWVLTIVGGLIVGVVLVLVFGTR